MPENTALKNKAESVGNSYNDFVKFVLQNDEEFGNGDDVIAYIDSHPGCTSGDVIGYVLDSLGFIEPLEIVPDPE